MTDAHYDVVVVGRSLAGLACATVLAKRKLRVRVLDPPDVAPASDRAPLFGFESAPIVRRLLDEVGLVHAARTRLEGPPRAVTLALPDRRLSLPPDPAERSAALGRAFPGLAAELAVLFDRIEGYGQPLDPLLGGDVELPPDGFGARRAWRKLVSTLPAAQLLEAPPPWAEHPLIRQLVAAMLAAAGRFDDPTGPITAGGARALWHLCHGITPLRGGHAGLEALLVDKRVTFGERTEARSAAELDVRRRRCVSVVTRAGQRYGVEALVFADDPPALRALRPELEEEAPRGHRGAVRVARADRPAPLHDPLGWAYEGGACLARSHEDHLDLTWLGAPPPADRLLPLTNAPIRDATPVWLPGSHESDPLGLARRPLRGPLKNMLWIGPATYGGLGLEGELLGAWLAAQAAEKMCPKRRRG